MGRRRGLQGRVSQQARRKGQKDRGPLPEHLAERGVAVIRPGGTEGPGTEGEEELGRRRRWRRRRRRTGLTTLRRRERSYGHNEVNMEKESRKGRQSLFNEATPFSDTQRGKGGSLMAAGATCPQIKSAL